MTQRLVLALSVAVALGACMDSPGETGRAVQGVSTTTIATDASSYAVNQSITVTWTGELGNVDDWIAIVPSGSPADSGWIQDHIHYTGGAVDGSFTFPGLPAGSYEARAYPGGHYDILASTTFTVVGAPTVATDMSTYAPNQAITVTWTNTPGNPTDWIALVPAGSPANSGFLQTANTNGQVNGSTTFTGLSSVGNYEARAYASGGYTILASTMFAVSSGSVVVTTSKSTYAVNEAVTVTWSGTPGNVDDWIAISPAGSPADSGWLQIVYTNGQVNGSYTFGGIATAGDYEARAYLAGHYTILGSATFGVTGITTDQLTYVANAPITVNWTSLPGNPEDYIALMPAGSPADSGFLQIYTTNGVRTGSHVFSSGLPAGSYEARSYAGGTYTILASTTFTVGAASGLTTDHSTYVPMQSIVVTWTSMPGRSQDWIAIVPAGSPADSGFLELTYANSQKNGSYTFAGLPVGNYEVRYYDEGHYTIEATATFSVMMGASNTCVPTSTPPVVGSISSGDITLDPTLQSADAALAVNLSTSILFVSVREAEPSPQYGGVMCTLHDVDTTNNLPAGVTCLRNNPGSDTGGNVVVHYTVVTFTSGVTVQRGVANTGFTNPTTVTLTSVDPTNTFVLLGGIAVGGTGWGNNEFVRAQVVDATTLDVRTAVAGTRVSWQVVSMTGATVQRGTASFASGDTSQAVSVGTAPTGSFVLASYTSDNQAGISAGALMLQASLSDPSTVLLSRDLGGSALDVSWEVVSSPFNTIAGLTTFAAGEMSRTEVATGASSTSSVGIAASQAVLGQSGGSTSYAGAGSTADLLGEAAATFTTAADSVTVQRSSSQASAEIPWTVLDFAHNCAGQ